MVYVPFGRWLPFGARSKSEPHLREANNVYPLTTGGFAPWPGLAQVDATSPITLAGTALGAAAFLYPSVVGSDTFYGLIIYTSAAGKLNIITGPSGPSDVTRAVGGDYGTTRSFDFALFKDQVIATNFDDDVQVRDNVDSSATKFAALGGSPPKAAFVTVFRDFVVLGRLDDGGEHPEAALHWSALNDVTGWTPGTDLSDRRTFPEFGRLTGITEDNGALYVYFDSAILRGVFVGPPQIIRFDLIWRGPGPTSNQPGHIARGDNREFFSSPVGYFERVGDAVQQIDEERELNRLYQGGRIAAVNLFRDHVIFFSGTPASPSDSLIFNYVTREWSKETANVLRRPITVPSGKTLTTQDFSPTVGNIIGFNASHQLVEIGGAAAATATFETSDIVDKENGRRLGVRAVRPDCGGSATVALAARETEGASVTFGTAVATGASGRASIRANGRYINARIHVAPGTFSTERAAMGLELELTEGGRGKR